MIKKQVATVYYSTKKKRRYFTKKAAISAEASAIILDRHPVEPYEHDTGAGYHIKFDEPDRFEKMHRRMSRLIKKQLKNES